MFIVMKKERIAHILTKQQIELIKISKGAEKRK